MTRNPVFSDAAPAALGPYSQAIVAGGFVFCSGTAGIDPATGIARDGIEAQTEQALQNLAAILEAAGASMDNLVKTTIFYTDVDDFAKLNHVYAQHMPEPPPTRSAPANVQLPHGLLISLDAIAMIPAEAVAMTTSARPRWRLAPLAARVLDIPFSLTACAYGARHAAQWAHG